MKTVLRAILPAAMLMAATAALASGQGWLTSYDAAVKLSKKTGKPIMADFTGSDWCTFCNRLHKEVFDQKAFKDWASKKVILLSLDYPQKKAQPAAIKKQNKMLADKYKVQAWPTILFVTASGKEIGRVGYMAGGPAKWLKSADQIISKKARPLPGVEFPPYVKNKTLYAKTDLRGKQAPKLEVEQWLTGKAPNTKGKVVLVDFWATWCGPCRALIPEMNEWRKKFGDELVVIGISDEKPDTVQAFLNGTPMNYNVGIDQQGRMKKILGVQGIPHVMIVSPDGVVRWQGFPGSEEDKLTTEKIQQIIKASKSH